MRESGSVTLITPGRRRRRLVGVRRPPEAAAVLHPPARPVGLIGGVGLALRPQLFLQAPLGLLQPRRARRRDRPRLLGAPLVQPALGLAQPPAPALRRRQLRRQLVAATITELLVLLGVDSAGLLEDLARDPLVVAVGVLGRVGVHLGAVDRDHLDVHQPGLGAQLQHLAEQLAQRPLVALAEARDRRVIRRLVGRDHAHRDVLMAAPLDPPRRPLADRVGVDQQRHHHRRIVRRPAPPVVAIAGQERRSDPSPRRHRARTTRGDPAATTPAGSAATTAPARDHTR